MTPATSIWSLYDMLRFHAENFLRIAEYFTRAQAIAEENKDIYKNKATQELVDRLNGVFDVIEANSKEIGMPVSRKLLATYRKSIDLETTFEEIVRKTTSLRDAVNAELSGCFLVCLDPKRVEFYTEKDLFGTTVTNNFPALIEDIEESGKCLALNRSTACVFHLMRIMEGGLRALGSSLSEPVDPKTNPTWERILVKADDELRKPLAQQSPEWKADHQFYSEATAILRVVKNAWRNPTLHIDKKYTVEEAMEVFNAVRAFMKHLSLKLKE